MALAVAGMAAGKTRIDTAECVDVSYPGFFQEMASMGARISV
jgi:3-phosphoshikimate 1-carboxyvinyltransferase